jgi:hypothetical protein
MGKMKDIAIDLANRKPSKDCDLPSAKYYQIYRCNGLEYIYCCDRIKGRSCLQMIYADGSWVFGPNDGRNDRRTVYNHNSGTTRFQKEN